jgi:nucleotide-binding universal stress UspA family protein
MHDRTLLKLGPVLVAVDLTNAAAEALRQGREIARARRVPLAVCHVSRDAAGTHEGAVGRGGWGAVRDRLAYSQLADWLTCTLGPDQLSIRDIVIESGAVSAGVLAAAERGQSDLVIFGARFPAREQRSWGALAAEVARDARCDVLIARPRGGGKVLAVGLSDDPSSLVAAANEQAAQRKQQLVVLGTSEMLERSAGDSPERTGAGSIGAAIIAAARVLPADLIVIERAPGVAAFGNSAAIVELVLRNLSCSVLLVQPPARASVASATSARNPHLQ